MGFFYRVFLSRAIGAEGMGLYQLVFPVYILASSITVSGIQTAISRLVSARTASVSYESGKTILLTGILISAGLSIPVSALLFFLASPIAIWYLKSPAATDLLRLVALAIPFGAFHACADGYYLGIRNTVVPAIRQLLEQAVRFLLLLPLYYGLFPHSVPLTPLIAVLILVLEECAAALFSFFTLFFSLSRPGNTPFLQKIRLFLQYHHTVLYSDSAELLSVALPLTGNRVVVLPAPESGGQPSSGSPVLLWIHCCAGFAYLWDPDRYVTSHDSLSYCRYFCPLCHASSFRFCCMGFRIHSDRTPTDSEKHIILPVHRSCILSFLSASWQTDYRSSVSK